MDSDSDYYTVKIKKKHRKSKKQINDFELSSKFNNVIVISPNENKKFNETIIILSTSNVVFNNDFIGNNTNSNSFLKNSIIIPFDCIINSISFSARHIHPNIFTTLYVNGNITNFNINNNKTNNKTFELKQNDLISFLINLEEDINLKNGVSVTLCLMKNKCC